jgi:hypothetical protein
MMPLGERQHVSENTRTLNGPGGLPIRAKMIDGHKYINATDMCKDANADLSNYQRSPQAIEFLEELGKLREYHGVKLVIPVQGRYGGTWMIEPVAHNYGQYINARYAVAVSILLTALNNGQAHVHSVSLPTHRDLVASSELVCDVRLIILNSLLKPFYILI